VHRVADCVAEAKSSHERVEASRYAGGIYLMIICETFVTMISGLPWYKVIFPDTHRFAAGFKGRGQWANSGQR
jgi:hypothetical protein